MLQGTGSDVGKSLIVAGLCRAYAKRGLRVRPFKPQNMSNNAAIVAGGGGEIGRAQALQAQACGVAPTVHMNPVLLKPQSNVGAQVVVQGKVVGNAAARDYHDWKPRLLPKVLESFRILTEDADLVLVEGAGSPAEVNLRAGDIANMGFAEAADVPVVLVADIDRGGVIANLVGTHTLLSVDERRRIAGFLINKFRGDPTLFTDGIAIIETHTGWRHAGTVPYFDRVRDLPAEDAANLASRQVRDLDGSSEIRVAVPMLSRIANFDEFDPLAAEPSVRLEFIPRGTPLPVEADMIVLPGSKATIADMQVMRDEGWDIDLKAYRRRGGFIFGICAGYQMLGRRVADPDGVEGVAGEVDGLGLLDVETVLTGDKTLAAVEGRYGEVAVAGYEMHVGRTTGADCARPFLTLANGSRDGAMSADGLVAGCYLHGLFRGDAFRTAMLQRVQPGRRATDAYAARVEETLDRLAGHLEAHLRLDDLLAAAGEITTRGCVAQSAATDKAKTAPNNRKHATA